MPVYIRLFDTYNDYIAVKDELPLPNVSTCKEDLDTVYYNSYDPYNGHDYVEIGGLKWATMNIGAESVTDYGLYFQWGDTQGYTASQCGSGSGQKYFGWADYKYGNGDSSYDTVIITKYNSTDGKTVLDLSDDAARANWGGSWRMPTSTELSAFSNAVNTAWTANYQSSGVAGMVCTDKSDNSKVLFFPAAGFCADGEKVEIGSKGYCWTSSGNNKFATDFIFGSSGHAGWGLSSTRMVGYTIRPVIDE